MSAQPHPGAFTREQLWRGALHSWIAFMVLMVLAWTIAAIVSDVTSDLHSSTGAVAILPILRSYGWPSTQVMNSRTWDRPESNLVTPAEADAWADVEFVHHGATHTDAPTLAALDDEIVTSLAELRAQLPTHQIDGWAPPGVTGTRYMGYNGGGTAELMSTDAGRLILAHHAWASGYQPDSRHRVLDGMVRQGLSHYTMDVATLAQVQTTVNGAIATEAGLCLMLHPSLLDTTGYMTTGTLTSVLAWLRTKEQAGDVQIVSLGALNYARKVA